MNNKHRQLRYWDYVEHMLEAVVQARGYVEGVAKENFLSDRKTQDAVILKMLVLGEAATHATTDAADLVARYPDIPWRQMRGMRNRMVHGYFDIDLEIVWDTVTTSLPELELKLRAILDTKLTSSES